MTADTAEAKPEVCFYSPSRKFTVSNWTKEKRYPSGQLDTPTGCIIFSDHFFRTDEKMKIKFLRTACEKSRNGMIREVSEEEARQLESRHLKTSEGTQLPEEIRATAQEVAV